MAETVEVLVPGGKATAGPPLGPALGPLGINVKAVVDEINKKTADESLKPFDLFLLVAKRKPDQP